MKKRILILATAFVVALVLTIGYTSCKKETEEETDTPDITAADDNSLADNIFSDVFTQVSDASENSKDSISSKKGSKGDTLVFTKGSCATITVWPAILDSFPKYMIVDFGSTNCICADGKSRRGKILVTVENGWYKDSASVHTITFDNYYVNDYKVQGTKTVTNKGRNCCMELWFHVVIDNAVITKPNGDVISWESVRERVWKEGEDTPWPVICDDVYEIYGTQSGTTATGKNYTITVIDSLNVQVCCKWIRGGVLELNIEGLPTITVDYGDDICDNLAVATVNGTDYTITMN